MPGAGFEPAGSLEPATFKAACLCRWAARPRARRAHRRGGRARLHATSALEASQRALEDVERRAHAAVDVDEATVEVRHVADRRRGPVVRVEAIDVGVELLREAEHVPRAARGTLVVARERGALLR